MTWTYSSTDLSTDLAKVRLLIGDTDTNDQQLTDEEIDFFTDDAASVYHAAASGCEALAAQYARRADKSIGQVSLHASQRQTHYHDLAAALRQRALTSVELVPYAGGISVGDKTAVEQESDRTKPQFALGWDDNQGTELGRASTEY